jgi:hypothetical protein
MAFEEIGKVAVVLHGDADERMTRRSCRMRLIWPSAH